MLKRLIRIAGLGLAAVTLFLWSSLGKSEAQYDVRRWPADRPCITDYSYSGSTLVIHWDGHENYDHYNVRWRRPGFAPPQYEVRGGSSGSAHIDNFQPGTTYTIAVQGCN